jgi:hypothetical protein
MKRLQFPPSAINCLEQIAWALSKHKQATFAAPIWGAIDQLRKLHGVALWPSETAEHERYVRMARSQLGDNVFSAAWESGAQWTLEQTIEAALAYLTNSAQHPATFLVQ